MKQLKCWSKRKPTVRLLWARPKIEQKAFLSQRRLGLLYTTICGDIRSLTLLTLSNFRLEKAYANSVYPNEMAHDEPSHQDLHYLPFC